jgi:hypothetical protein
MNGEKRNAYRILVRKPEETTRKTKMYVGDIKMDLKKGRCGMDWIELAQDRDQWSAIVNTVMNLRAP